MSSRTKAFIFISIWIILTGAAMATSWLLCAVDPILTFATSYFGTSIALAVARLIKLFKRILRYYQDEDSNDGF